MFILQNRIYGLDQENLGKQRFSLDINVASWFIFPHEAKVYTVKQLSKLAGVSVRTLHYYEQIGLLKPSSLGGNGYRYYEEEALLKLRPRQLRQDAPATSRVHA